MEQNWVNMTHQYGITDCSDSNVTNNITQTTGMTVFNNGCQPELKFLTESITLVRTYYSTSMQLTDNTDN